MASGWVFRERRVGADGAALGGGEPRPDSAIETPRFATGVPTLALRQQLGVLQRSVRRPRLRNADRAFWVLMSRWWGRSGASLLIVKPATVIRWHRAGFRRYWRWKSRRRAGRPHVDAEIRALIRRMARTNLWGAPRIHGELLKLGVTAPRYLLRDRDAIYGGEFCRRVKTMGIQEVRIAARSPWQSPYVERVIGTLRRELLDHVIVLGEPHLCRLLRRYLDEYYHPCRTHLSLGKDTPMGREVEPPEIGEVTELPVVGGLHHRYTRRAA
jgi:hypothetical protein